MAVVTGRLDRATGLWSKSLIEKLLMHEAAQAERYTLPLSLLRLALHSADSLNKSDALTLREMVSNILNTHLRAADCPGHYGDEYLVVLPGTDEAGGKLMALRLARAVATLRLPGKLDYTAALCVGIAFRTGGPGTDPERLLAEATAALAEARQRGAHSAVSFAELR